MLNGQTCVMDGRMTKNAYELFLGNFVTHDLLITHA